MFIYNQDNNDFKIIINNKTYNLKNAKKKKKIGLK